MSSPRPRNVHRRYAHSYASAGTLNEDWAIARGWAIIRLLASWVSRRRGKPAGTGTEIPRTRASSTRSGTYGYRARGTLANTWFAPSLGTRSSSDGWSAHSTDGSHRKWSMHTPKNPRGVRR